MLQTSVDSSKNRSSEGGLEMQCGIQKTHMYASITLEKFNMSHGVADDEYKARNQC
jgi:hypothetical protein